MKEAASSLLCCPRCHGDLSLAATAGAGARVDSGTLACGACSVEFPIRKGIPRFVDDDQYAAHFGWQWDRYRRTQIDRFNGTTESERRFRRETGWSPRALEGALTLDAGCGSGRFTQVAAEWGAKVVAVDLAGPAAEACATNLRELGLDALVVQASLFDLPLRAGAFDRVFSLGVLQHTPDPARAIQALPALLRPGGELAYWMYERRWYDPLMAKHLLRPLTRRLPPRYNHRLSRALVSTFFPLTAALSKVPVARLALPFMPIASRHLWGRLSLRQQWEWSVLDTLDWLGPGHDDPQEEGRVLELLRLAGLEEVRRLDAPGLAVAARRPGASTGRARAGLVGVG